jgi:hypothetical protein
VFPIYDNFPTEPEAMTEPKPKARLKWRKDIARNVVRGDWVCIEDIEGEITGVRDTQANGQDCIELIVRTQDVSRVKVPPHYKGRQYPVHQEIRYSTPENYQVRILTKEDGSPRYG